MTSTPDPSCQWTTFTQSAFTKPPRRDRDLADLGEWLRERDTNQDATAFWGSSPSDELLLSVLTRACKEALERGFAGQLLGVLASARGAQRPRTPVNVPTRVGRRRGFVRHPWCDLPVVATLADWGATNSDRETRLRALEGLRHHLGDSAFGRLFHITSLRDGEAKAEVVISHIVKAAEPTDPMLALEVSHALFPGIVVVGTHRSYESVERHARLLSRYDAEKGKAFTAEWIDHFEDLGQFVTAERLRVTRRESETDAETGESPVDSTEPKVTIVVGPEIKIKRHAYKIVGLLREDKRARVPMTDTWIDYCQARCDRKPVGENALRNVRKQLEPRLGEWWVRLFPSGRRMLISEIRTSLPDDFKRDFGDAPYIEP